MGLGRAFGALGALGALGRWVKAIVTFDGYFAKRRAAARAERQQEREVILRAFDTMQANFQQGLEALSRISIAASHAQTAQADALRQWIEGFKQAGAEAPTSHTMRDEDEVQLYYEQQQANLPPEVRQLPYEQQVAWVLQHSGDPLY